MLKPPLAHPTSTPSTSILTLADRTVWLLALGYFASYVVYAILVKREAYATSNGLVLLPSVTVGTAFALSFLMVALGAWRTWPHFTKDTVIAGFATGVIIVTTTLAYTFQGVSIVFALLLLRGGVLMLAPVVDTMCRRKVRGFCWLALLLSAAAIVIAVAHTHDTRMTVVASLNTIAYLAAYVVRLPHMTRCAKVSNKQVTRDWFVAEATIALAVQLLLPLLGSATPSRAGAYLRSGFADISAIGLLIGVFYGSLYFFGTSVYLDHRENSFCVPLNRGASLIAGVTAAVMMGRPPTIWELTGVSLVIFALVFLSPVHHVPHASLATRPALHPWHALRSHLPGQYFGGKPISRPALSVH